MAATKAADRPDRTALVAQEVRAGDALTLAAAAKLFAIPAKPEGFRPKALRQWAAVGLAGPDGLRIKLGVVKVGAVMLTSRQELRRFAAAVGMLPPAD